jgi:hypothetical protein
VRRVLSCIVWSAALAGCGFPDLAYSQGSADGSSDVTTADVGSPDSRADDAPGREAAAGNDASSDAADLDGASDAPSSSDAPSVDKDAAVDGVAPDATGTSDSGNGADASSKDAEIDARTDSGTDCDQDKDGYKAKGGACGGNDCCDTDPNAHPGQTMFFTNADACGSYDYNCDGTIETEISTMITCTGLGVTGCSGGPGFTGDPACGTSAPYNQCQGSGLGCAAMSTMSATQACQ